MLEAMRKKTPHGIRIHELANKLKLEPSVIRYWESLGLDIQLSPSDIIKWRERRSCPNVSVEHRGNLDKGLARMIVVRSGRSHTQQEIADYCGVSRPRIAEVEGQALRRLRRTCAAKGIKLEDFASALGTEFR